MITTMTAAQAALARRIAGSYGHMWAGEHSSAGLTDPAAIRDSLRDEDGNLPHLGIDAPRLDNNGVVVETTATGRTSWRIAQDGSASVSISRPAPVGAVLTASVGASGVVSIRWLAPSTVEERHVAALAHWLRAATGDAAWCWPFALGAILRALDGAQFVGVRSRIHAEIDAEQGF